MFPISPSKHPNGKCVTSVQWNGSVSVSAKTAAISISSSQCWPTASPHINQPLRLSGGTHRNTRESLVRPARRQPQSHHLRGSDRNRPYPQPAVPPAALPATSALPIADSPSQFPSY